MKYSIDDVRSLMARLRDPDKGCPWDVEQTFTSIAPYAIEEAYEVEDAITRGNMADLKAELGDLLLQVVFHSQMANEQGIFDFDDVVSGLGEKLVSRHPHVFVEAPHSAQSSNLNASDVKHIWEQSKAREREAKRALDSDQTIHSPKILADVLMNMPSLMVAHKLQKRAASVGFDWSELPPVLDKLYEELDELKAEITADNKQKQQEEFGDLLFAVVNLGRHLGLSSETALRAANRKFISRFNFVEQQMGDREAFVKASLDELNEAWNQAKQSEQDSL